MDSRPPLEARPPALIETIVRLLVPTACREHVVGDLWERYRSPHGFLMDAARTLPFVIASQIRRTSTISSVVIQGFVLSVAFATFGGPLLRSVIPVVAGLLGLVLRDAYKRCVSLSAKQVSVDVAVGGACVLVSQAFVGVARPDLLTPLSGMLGCAAAFGLLFPVRLQSPGLGTISRQVTTQFSQSLDGLLAEVRLRADQPARSPHRGLDGRGRRRGLCGISLVCAELGHSGRAGPGQRVRRVRGLLRVAACVPTDAVEDRHGPSPWLH